MSGQCSDGVLAHRDQRFARPLSRRTRFATGHKRLHRVAFQIGDVGRCVPLAREPFRARSPARRRSWRNAAAAAIELMGSMRHDDGTLMLTPPAGAVRHEEARIHGQRDLNRVMRVGLDTTRVAADPEAATAPEQHTADARDRAPRRRCSSFDLRALSQRRQPFVPACARRSAASLRNAAIRLAVSFKFGTRLLARIHPTDPPGPTFNLPGDFHELSVHHSCQCVDCPGSSCLCGCQANSTPSTRLVAGQACTCACRCGCEAAEQGCLCSPLQS